MTSPFILFGYQLLGKVPLHGRRTYDHESNFLKGVSCSFCYCTSLELRALFQGVGRAKEIHSQGFGFRPIHKL
ncbi:hypothetical protein AMTR_s00065p00093700 [Amborella trichopoda]|uniref:Uncharacterized protein n=1 Tax=Amborella trichopoda TaxID=13333 RepID=U5DDT2_AMBTC|nr:hypothetical protein AMTR_s00065p00093700 [Amborella trichopoda]